MSQTDDYEQAQARREYLRQQFGDDVLEGLATDTSARRTQSSAQKHAKRLKRDEQEAAQELHLEQLRHLAQEQREDLALERAMTEITAGRTPNRTTTLLAARAQQRHGGSGMSSAEKLALGHD
jgi:hypothetical protein